MYLFQKVACRLLTAALVAPGALAQTSSPVAPVRPVTDTYFGTKVVDNYRWMENLKDPEMQRWMKAQSDFTRATLDALPGYHPLLKRIAELESSEPAEVTGVQLVAGRYYSLRTPANAQSPKLYVRDGINGKDRLLIDPENMPGNDKSHFSIHGYLPSPDGRYIAYQLTAGGDGQPVLHVYDVRACNDLPETADRNFGDPQWRNDNVSFFYARGQKADRRTTARLKNERVYLHVLGRTFDDDPPILGHGISDATVAITPDEPPEIVTAPGSHYAIARIQRGNDARLRIYAAPIDAIRDSTTAWRAIAPSYDDQYIGSDNVDFPVVALTGDELYWLSRKNAPRGEILKLDLARADSKPEVIVAQGRLPISKVYAGRDAIYWRVSDAGVNSIHRLRFVRGARPETLHLPYSASILAVFPDPLSDAAVILASSWLRASAYLSINARSVVTTTNDLQPPGPGDRPDDLVAEEVKVPSWDGTLVPLSIVYRGGTKLDGNNPTILGGYGAYGTTPAPQYSATQRTWFEHGGIWAIAHVRGGGEYGEAWHQAGFQATKPAFRRPSRTPGRITSRARST